MSDVLTVRGALCRLDSDGLHISEYALRRIIKEGCICVRYVGRKKALIYYPSLARYLKGLDPYRDAETESNDGGGKQTDKSNTFL